MLINWDKPKKLRSTKEHNEMYMSDCEVDGTYVSNMSRQDKETWKGTLKTHKDGSEQVELRKTFGSAQLLIIVADDGYNYKYYKRDPEKPYQNSTKEFNMHVSMNGPLQLTFDQWEEIGRAVQEARNKLVVSVSKIEQPKKPGKISEREVVYMWLELPYSHQVYIARDLDVLGDDKIEFKDFGSIIYKRIKEKGKYDQLVELVKEYTEKRKNS